MGLQRSDVYIANILKCRPDTPGQSFGNRKPTPEEMQAALTGDLDPETLAAAEAFEKAEDFERASYCYERSGNDHKAKQLKEKAKLAPYKGRAGSPAFALGSVQSSQNQNNFGSAQDNESTAVVNLAAKPAAPATAPLSLASPRILPGIQ